jgi:hypothetical protein
MYNIYIMSFIRSIIKKSASGEEQVYYAEVESYWDKENKKTRQRVIRYLGKYPYQNKFELEPDLASQVARAIGEKGLSREECKQRLENLGISVPPGEFQEAKIVFNPPLGKPTLHIYCK